MMVCGAIPGMISAVSYTNVSQHVLLCSLFSFCYLLKLYAIVFSFTKMQFLSVKWEFSDSINKGCKSRKKAGCS